ncbi:MAG TPA: M3 family metallopeptidase, partial [Phenylobacterium sp.]|nr:M3 family metallopeptidase [Phenylobacterium sp.]
MNAPSKTQALPEWSLADLYARRDDPKIAADIAKAKTSNDALAALEGRFLAVRADPKALGQLIDKGVKLYEAATNGLWAVGAYAALAGSCARNDPAWSKFEGDLRAKSAVIAAESLFFTLELNRLEDAEIEAALKAYKPAAKWRPWLRRVRLSRPHELSPDLERMLIDRGPAVANWSRLSEETLAHLSAKVEGESLTLSETLNRLSDPDGKRRKHAAKGLAKALEKRASTLALCLNTLAFEKQVEDRWRKYPDPAASRHIANEVDADAVAALETAVVESYATVSHRYYRLKAKVMGKKVLDQWDRNAPLDTAAPRTYSWDQARAMVLDSFSDLAPKFADTAQTFFTHPWIDARPRAGKQSGAYSHPVTADRHPYVFLNYMGERRDVLTLAHELGHA